MNRMAQWLVLGGILLCGCLAVEVAAPPTSKLRLWDGISVGTGGYCPGESIRADHSGHDAATSALDTVTFGQECIEEEQLCSHPEVNAMLHEYDSWPADLRPEVPTCDDFSMVGGNVNFSWPELNRYWQEGNEPRHNPWGFIRTGTMSGLNHTLFFYNPGVISLASGYRCPTGNAQIRGAVPYSHHVRGRAVDMFGKSPWTQEEYNALLASALSSYPPPIEWFDYYQYADHHLHVAW